MYGTKSAKKHIVTYIGRIKMADAPAFGGLSFLKVSASCAYYTLHRRKKSLLVIFVICCVFACNLIWTSDVRMSTKTSSTADGLPMSIWNDSRSLSTTGIMIDKALEDSTRPRSLIAIGCAITSNKLHNVSDNNIREKFLFLDALLPSFCNTSSAHYTYRFYLAYDHDDDVFTNQRLRDAFQRQFYSTTTSGVCRDRRIITNLSLVQCNYSGKPAWAQNDAMLEAYLDHVDYFYRINDDTLMLTRGWTEKFIATLESYDPPSVGVVGPNSTGDWVTFLTYEFVHHTHVDIFGFYYPRLFSDWFGDMWITFVYQPNRSTKPGEVRLAHTHSLGRRYEIYSKYQHVGSRVAYDKSIVNR